MVSEQNCECEYFRNIKLKNNNNLGTTSLAILNPQAGQSKERWSQFFQRLKFFFWDFDSKYFDSSDEELSTNDVTFWSVKRPTEIWTQSFKLE